MWAEVKNELVVRIFTRPEQIVDASGIVYSSSVFMKWSDIELQNINIHQVIRDTNVNKKYYNVSPTYVYNSGTNLVTESLNSTPKPINELKDIKKLDVDAKKTNTEISGFNHTISTVVYPFDSDMLSIQKIIGMVAAIGAGISIPAGFTWTTMDNQEVSLDAIEMVNLGSVALTHVNDSHANSRTHKTAIDAFTSGQEQSLIDYDISTGWPINPLPA